MQPGDVVGGRFAVDRLAGGGGMGEVWRAHDHQTGQRVALKVLNDASDGPRFVREAELLATLSHATIVRYLAHGVDRSGRWVAMEWLEGEDLRQRLQRLPLSLVESLVLGRRVANALAIAHAKGIVHRDVKPGNILLPAARVEDATLIDFGIARATFGVDALTRPGMTVGTPGYMAPEQASGEPDVDARADVFSLGCVLFRCFTGVAAFHGDNLLAILAKVLMEPAPHVRELVEHLPLAVDDLVARMLAKDRTDRPADGGAVATELARILSEVGAPDAPTPQTLRAMPTITRSAPLSPSEAIVASVVMLGGRVSGEVTATLADDSVANERLRILATAFGARISKLADGSILALVGQQRAAKDQAATAARLALELHALMPHHPCALATGRAAVHRPWPVGEAIDGAVRLLGPGENVRIDRTTSGLLDTRFRVEGDELLGIDDEIAARTVMGKVVPYVGRERELALLEGLFAECRNEGGARAVLVTGLAGMGKSRIVSELIGRLRARAEHFMLWMGRGDPMTAGTLGVLVDAVRRGLNIQAGEPATSQHGKIELRTSRPTTAWFLAEMVGAPFDDASNPVLRAARSSVQLMGDQLRRAFEDFMSSETERAPVILVLEDIHWSDAGSVSLVDSMLRVMVDRPLLVVATARPEIQDVFPKLWHERSLMLLPLGALGQKAAATMVRTVLPDAPDDRVAQLIERAGGSALFLEELVRADAEGRGGETPGSVLAMMQSKLEALPADQRRVLRAASVFGRAFWRGAIADLVHAPDFTLDVLLAALVERDLLVRVTGARFPMEREYVFRHDLVREGAYALLTEEDRVAAHRHAGRWLARAGESDAAVLAEHYDKGADGQRAIASYVIAARHALEHNELGAADALAARAMRCGANGHARGELLAVQAEVAWWTADLVSATDLGEAALRELEPGVVWSVTACVVARAAASLGDATRADAVARAILRAPMPDARVAVGIYRAATSLLLAGRDALAGELAAGVPVFDDAGVRAARFSYLANVHGARGETGAALESNMAALAAANEAGDARLACVVSCNLGLGLGEVGDDVAAQQLVIQVVHEAQRLGLQRVLAGAKANLGVIRARQGATAEGVALIRESIESGRELADARLEGASHAYLAELLLQQRDHTLARGEAIEAAQLLAGVPLASFAFAVLCRIELARGDVTAARAAASRIELTRIEENEAYIRLAWAEALRAGGDLAGASASIHGARDRLLTRAATMAPHHRTSFLENVAENARTLVLAREWGV